MSQTPGTGSSREDRPSTEFAASGTSSAAPYASVARETVMRQESRQISPGGSFPVETPASWSDGSSVALSPSSFDSQVWRRLFPAEIDPAGVEDADAPTGCELGHFLVEERIGSGGMGAVFRALDNRLQRVVALKVLSPAQSRDRAAVLRFENEARAAARLDHENIARVYYVGEDRGLHFIAFEYVTGQNVRDLITRTGRLSVSDAINYVLQIASALRHTAAAGVVHRDIKPSNIIIAPNGRAKLVDLGLARKLTPDGLGDLTVAGTTLGTFDYISPEQARDPRNVDVRSDIYSLGCTLYHMLTGGPPYSSGTVLQKLLDHQSGQAPDPQAINAQVPPALAAICRKMMAGDPKNRYQTPDDLIRDLAVVAAGFGLRPVPADGFVWTRPAAQAAPRLKSGFIWAGITAIVVLIAFLVDRWPSGIDTASTDPSAVALPANDQRVPAGQAAANPGQNRDSGAGRPTTAMASPPMQSEPPIEAPSKLRRAIDDQPQAVSASPVQTTDQPIAQDQLIAQDPPYTDEPFDATGSNTGVPSVPIPPGGTDGGYESTIVAGDANTFFETDQAENTQFWDELTDQASTAVEVVRPYVEALASAEPEPLPSWIEPLPYRPSRPFVRRSLSQEDQVYNSLSEAIADALPGDAIELHFNGRMPGAVASEPLVIDGKAVTIRAGLDDRQNVAYRPLIEFVGDPRSSDGSQMIAISGSGGGLRLQGVELRFTVSGEARNDVKQWSLFSLAAAEQIWLTDVGITVDNRESWPGVSVFDLRPPEGVSSEAYEMMGMMNDARNEGFLVELNRCFVRGGADLITIAHTLPGRIEISDSAFALQSALLNVTGGIKSPPTGDAVDVDFERVTAVVGDALLRLSVGTIPRYAATIRVTARESVFSTSTAGPLVFMTGNASPSTFEQALEWDGRSNVFDGFPQFWSIRTEDGPADSVSTFQLWKSRWHGSMSPMLPEGSEEHAAPPDATFSNIWLTPSEAKGKLHSSILPEDLLLNPDDAPEGWLDTDTAEEVIGAPVSRLPRPSRLSFEQSAGNQFPSTSTP